MSTLSLLPSPSPNGASHTWNQYPTVGPALDKEPGDPAAGAFSLRSKPQIPSLLEQPRLCCIIPNPMISEPLFSPSPPAQVREMQKKEWLTPVPVER